MSHLDPERVALVALGEELTDAETEHLATCDACAVELAKLEHTVAVGRSTASLGELETPPERVWERIREEVGSAESASPVTDTLLARRRRMWRRTLFTLAAGIAAVLVVAGVWNLLRPPQPVELASAILDAFPAYPGASGTAEVTELADGERTLTVRLDDAVEADGFREVWLITADASALVSLGELDGTTGTFVVPADVDLRDYVLVDISQEPLDGDPAHSGDSIVRGELEFS